MVVGKARVVGVVLYCEGKEDELVRRRPCRFDFFAIPVLFMLLLPIKVFVVLVKRGRAQIGLISALGLHQLWSFTILYTALEFHDIHSFGKLVFGAHTFCDIGKT